MRFLTVVVATVALLLAGLVGPAAGEPAPDAPDTVVRAMRGLPAARPGARLSRQVQTPIPFSMVGFEVPVGASLEFRTSVDGGRWTPWQEAEIAEEEGPDPGSPEAADATARGTMPIWVGEASSVQTRLDGGKHAHPRNVTVHLVDSSGLGRSWPQRVADRLRSAWNATPTAAHAAVGRPDIVTRAEWGANESLRSGSPSYAARIRAGFVHHTVNSNNYSQAEADDLVRGIYSYHTQSNGWSDMGYNFLVDRFGTVYEGRYGGITRPVIGAHAGGFNTETFGVSLIGSFDNASPPTDMLRGLRRLLAWKYDVHSVSVLGETPYTSYGSTRYEYGTTVMIKRLSGHRDASNTACPGDKTYALLPTLRRQVARLQGPVVLSPSVTPTTVQIVDGHSVSGPVSFRADLRPAGEWNIKITSPEGVISTIASGDSEQVSYDWTPQNVAPGTYGYRIGGGGRRGVRGWITFESPHIEGSTSRQRTTFAPDGRLNPVTFTGSLYENADWKVRIFDPAGNRVERFMGTGPSFSKTWDKPVSVPGVYRWDLSADGGTPVEGSVVVAADFVDRIARQPGAAVAAAGISRRTFPTPGTAVHAVLAPSSLPGHTLAAGPLAGTLGPVLYSHTSSLPDETLTELERVLPNGATVYVMGDAISDAALGRVDMTRRGKWRIHRIDGASGATVAAAAAPLVQARSGATSVVLAGNTGSGAWRQNVAAGAYATNAGVPILLTPRAELSRAAAASIARPGITNVTVIGNTDAVSPAVVETVRERKPARRMAAHTSAGTAVEIARRLFGRASATGGERWLFASSDQPGGWTRALAASPLAASTDAPLLLARSGGVPGATVSYLDALGYGPLTLGHGSVLGDADQISAAARTTLARRLQ